MRPSLLSSPAVLIEFGFSSLKVRDGAEGLELPLERSDNGRLTTPCADRLVQGLQTFLRPRARSGKRPALCAIGLRGVSIRRLTLPRAARDEMDRLVLLQIEREFPLPPEELAWGYHPLPPTGREPAQTTASSVLVAAIKRDLLQQYEEILDRCDLDPCFTVAALVRDAACDAGPENFAILDIGRSGSELIVFEHGQPSSTRSLPMGGELMTQAIARHLGISRPDAEQIKLELQRAEIGTTDRTVREAARAVLGIEVAAFAASFPKDWVGSRLFLTGGSAGLEGLAETLGRALGPGATCERPRVSAGPGESAAMIGLQRCREKPNGRPSLVLAISKGPADRSRNGALASWKWAALAAVLALLCVALRYAESALGQAQLNRQLVELKARQDRLPQVDRELGFLQYVRSNQPPYLDLISTLASAAPAGTRLDSVSLNRRGDLALRATLRSSEQVMGFRSKLIESGRFAAVVVDEQTPSPDQQKVTVRITGQRGNAPSRLASPGAPGSTNVTVPTNAPGSNRAAAPSSPADPESARLRPGEAGAKNATNAPGPSPASNGPAIPVTPATPFIPK